MFYEKIVYWLRYYFKVVAAIGAVDIHANVPAVNTLGRLVLPYFAIVSSFLFFTKYNRLPKKSRFTYGRLQEIT